MTATHSITSRPYLLTGSSGSHWFSTGSLVAKVLLAFASIVIPGSESNGTHDHILLSDRSRSLQTTHPWLTFPDGPRYGPHSKHRFQRFLYCCVSINSCGGQVSLEPLPSKGRPFVLHYSAFQVSCHYIYDCTFL
jgi:hypothetical protein